MVTGCASYKIKSPTGEIISQGECSGFMRTITVTERYNEFRTCIERKISTDSNSKEVLMGINELIDTAVDTAGKIK